MKSFPRRCCCRMWCRKVYNSIRGGGQMSSVQLSETGGNSARWGRGGRFASASICKILKPSIVPVSTSKPKFSLLEAPGVSVRRPKPHVFMVSGALSCIGIISASRASSLHPGHLRISGTGATRQESQGAAPPAQPRCRRVSARAAESSSSQTLSFLYKSLAASFS